MTVALGTCGFVWVSVNVPVTRRQQIMQSNCKFGYMPGVPHPVSPAHVAVAKQPLLAPARCYHVQYSGLTLQGIEKLQP